MRDTTKHLSYGHTSLKHRVRLTAKYLERRRKLGNAHMALALVEPATWQHLRAGPPLDGLSLYRHSLGRLRLPRQLASDQGRTIMIIGKI